MNPAEIYLRWYQASTYIVIRSIQAALNWSKPK